MTTGCVGRDVTSEHRYLGMTGSCKALSTFELPFLAAAPATLAVDAGRMFVFCITTSCQSVKFSFVHRVLLLRESTRYQFVMHHGEVIVLFFGS